MIKGNLTTLDKNLDKKIYSILNQFKSIDLISEKLGVHKLDGENFFVRARYETKNYEETFIEAHKKYIDIHLILSGSEIIEVELIEKLKVKEKYNEDKDCLILSGETQTKILLLENDFLICYPQDAHRVGIKNSKSNKVEKIVIKILIKEQ